VGLLLLLGSRQLLGGLRLPRFRQVELPDDGPAIATSPAAARQFVEKVTVAGRSGAQTGQLTLTVTEQEVTSFLQIGSQLREQLQAAGNVEHLEDLAQLDSLEGLHGIEGLEQWQQLARQREGLPRIPLSDLSLRLGLHQPEVRFLASGGIVVRGEAKLLWWRQPFRVVVAPRASDGELVLDFVEGRIGPLPLPEWLFDLIGVGLARAILIGQDYAAITRIAVADGTLTFSGRYHTGLGT
jgi:hypothetical protein